MRCLILFLLVCLTNLGTQAGATPIQLDGQSSGKDLNEQIELLEDIGDQLTIDAMAMRLAT